MIGEKKRMQERIKRNITIDEETGCWIWERRINNQGYPTLNAWVDGKHTKLFAHRVSLSVFKRPPKEGEEAAHCPYECRYLSCVNPKHLRWASHSENELDKRVHKFKIKVRELHPPLAREQHA